MLSVPALIDSIKLQRASRLLRKLYEEMPFNRVFDALFVDGLCIRVDGGRTRRHRYLFRDLFGRFQAAELGGNQECDAGAGRCVLRQPRHEDDQTRDYVE